MNSTMGYRLDYTLVEEIVNYLFCKLLEKNFNKRLGIVMMELRIRYHGKKAPQARSKRSFIERDLMIIINAIILIINF